MATTNVANGSNLALTQYSVAVTAQIIRAPGNINSLTGPAPKLDQAEGNIKLQTDPGMPFVRVSDLSTDPKGDTVTVDAFDVSGGKPIMGDRNAEGRGVALSSSSFSAKIDLATFNVDAGGKMSRQRTRHDLRRIAKAQLAAYFPRFLWQRAIVHLAGARGAQSGQSWDVPLSTDADYADIMVNTVKAPTYNRHYVVNAGSLTNGGLQLASLATTDVWKLSVLDDLAFLLDSMETKIPAPKFVGDAQASDNPLKAVLMMPPASYNALITDISSTTANLRAYQAAATERAKYAANHPIFMGEVGIWRGILVKKMEHSIYFNGSDSFNYVTVANKLTETETAGTVAALDATHVAERSILLGAQALARCEGASNSGVQAAIIENTYNAGRNYEYLGEFMGGEMKFRFKFKNLAGDQQYTDNGVMVIDAAASKRVV
jgi:N4-gp56 family major capsid protein